MPNPPHINTQVNQPIVHGNLVVQGDVVTYQSGFKAARYFTGIPQRQGELIGRKTELSLLGEQIREKRVVLLNGMGGVGKTALAVSWLHQELEGFTHIVWIEQTSDIYTSLITNRSLLENLDIKLGEDPQQDARLILNQLGKLGGPSILIIDNAEEDLEELRDYLPRDDWQILITSRNKLSIGHELTIENLELAAAQQLFFRHYDRDQDEQAVQEIIKELDRHTLTLEILAKTAQARRIQPLRRVLDLLEERGLAIGRQANVEIDHNKGRKVERLFPYLSAILRWTSSAENEKWLLQQLIFLPPIFHTFDRLATIFYLKPEYEDLWDLFTLALDNLTERGWLQYQEKEGYKMHRIIREVLYQEMIEELKFDDALTVIVGVKQLLRHNQYRDNPAERFPLVVYGDSVLTQIKEAWRKEEAVAALQLTLGSIYQDMGNYRQAIDIQLAATKTVEGIHGQDAPIVGTYKSNLSLSYWKLGQLEQAAEHAEAALTIEKLSPEPDRLSMAVDQSNLGVIYNFMGPERYEAAEKLLLASLQAALDLLESGDLIIATRKSNLANLYIDMERHAEGAKLLEEAVDLSIQHLTEDHPLVALRQTSLGVAYHYLGRAKESHDLHQKALTTTQKHYGPLHPKVALIQMNLGDSFLQQDQLETARALFEQAYQTRLQLLGPDHHDTLTAKDSLDHLDQQADA